MSIPATVPPSSDWITSFKNIVSLCRDLVVLVAIYLYFAGFTYKYYVYDAFHIRGVLDQVPPYVAFVFAYSVFSSHWIQLLLFIAGFACGLILVRNLSNRAPRFGKGLLVALAVVFAIGAFPVLNRWSWDTAMMEVAETRLQAALGNDLGLTLVRNARNAYGADFLFAASGDGLHLLARTDQNDYFLLQPADPNASATVVVVPVSEIANIHFDQ
jgi:hypothetical protein